MTFNVQPMPRVDWTPAQRRALERLPYDARQRVINTVETTRPRDAAQQFPVMEREQADEMRRLARISNAAPLTPWEDFYNQFKLDWKNGEHVGIIGPTGQGKTNLLVAIAPLHYYVVVCATKPKDTSMDVFVNAGWLKMPRWISLDADQFPKRVLWPNIRSLDAVKEQTKTFHEAFGMIYMEGGWTVVIDELWYVSNIMKLTLDVKMFLLQSRSLHISLVLATQRPSAVPLEVYDQTTHQFYFRDNDERNLDRISGINKRSSAVIKEIVSNLDTHQMLYINVRTGQMLRTTAPKVTPSS